MKNTVLHMAALAGAILSFASPALGQAHFYPGGGGAGGYPGGGGAGGYAGVEPLVVLPYSNGGGSNSAIQAPGAPVVGGGQGQAGQVPAGPNVIEQQEDLAEQQAPSMVLSDPDDSALEQRPMDDPQDASGFEGLQAIDNVDSSY